MLHTTSHYGFIVHKIAVRRQYYSEGRQLPYQAHAASHTAKMLAQSVEKSSAS